MPTLQFAAPFVVAALAGAALAFFELLKTFQRTIGSALRNRWGLALLGINALSAIGVFTVFRYVFGFDAGIWTALVVGITFPLVIRSRFTFYRQPGEKDATGLTEVSLKIDEFYQTLQDWCYTEVNALLAGERKALAEELKARFTAKQLEKELRELIDAEVMPAKRKEHQKKLGVILDEYQDSRRQHALALLLIDISTPRKIREMIR